ARSQHRVLALKAPRNPIEVFLRVLQVKQSKGAIDRQRLFIAQERAEQLSARQRRVGLVLPRQGEAPMEVAKGQGERLPGGLTQDLEIQTQIWLAFLQVAQGAQTAVAHHALFR